MMRQRWPALLAISAFATLPTALLSKWMAWEIVDPGGYLAELCWNPALLWAQLKALSLLDGGSAKARPAKVVQTFSAELILALRFSGIALLCLLPACFVLSWLGLEKPANRALVLALALAGLAPGLLYVLRRFFAAPLILFQSLGASAALQESARLTRDKLRLVLGLLLLGSGLVLSMEGLAQISFALSLFCLPAAFLINQVVIYRCYRKLVLSF